MEEHDTLSFNTFICQNFLNIDFHLFRNGNKEDLGRAVNKKDYKSMDYIDIFKGLTQKDKFKNTVYLLQYDLMADSSFELLSNFVFKKDTNIYGYSTRSRQLNSLPSKELKDGLIHSAGTLTDCVNFAYAMDYKKIILVGVDLYDRRYFWLDHSETRNSDISRGAKCDELHNTSVPMVDVIKLWKERLDKEGIEIYVYNKRSLLAEFLPVFKFK